MEYIIFLQLEIFILYDIVSFCLHSLKLLHHIFLLILLFFSVYNVDLFLFRTLPHSLSVIRSLRFKTDKKNYLVLEATSNMQHHKCDTQTVKLKLLYNILYGGLDLPYWLFYLFNQY